MVFVTEKCSSDTGAERDLPKDLEILSWIQHSQVCIRWLSRRLWWMCHCKGRNALMTSAVLLLTLHKHVMHKDVRRGRALHLSSTASSEQCTT